MKLKSPNVWFIFGTVPVLVLDFVLGAWFARGMVWLSVVLLLRGLLAAVALVRKFIVMPKPRNRYGTPEPFALELPINCNAEFYHCPEMAKYEFLHRTVEVVSPLWNGKKPFQVMINPTLAEKYGQDFEKVAVVRELENFRRKNSLKSLVGCCSPWKCLRRRCRQQWLLARSWKRCWDPLCCILQRLLRRWRLLAAACICGTAPFPSRTSNWTLFYLATFQRSK